VKPASHNTWTLHIWYS